MRVLGAVLALCLIQRIAQLSYFLLGACLGLILCFFAALIMILFRSIDHLPDDLPVCQIQSNPCPAPPINLAATPTGVVC